MAVPAIAQPTPIPAAAPLETPGWLGTVVEVDFGLALVVRFLDIV